MKSELDDEEYEHISDYAMSETCSDAEDDMASITTAPTTRLNQQPSDVRKLSCPYDGCSKTFNRKARLDEHLRSHTNTRPYKCPHCPKDFLRDSHLKHHVKSAHSDIRDYTCSYVGCGKSFATGTRLRRHEATHSGDNKYTCTGYEGCNQTFRKKETLSRHILQVHEGIKPFKCTEMDSATEESCKKTFDTADKLKSHQRSMHDPTKFSCTICVQAQALAYRDSFNLDNENSAYFSTYTALKRHLDSAHPPTCPLCSLAFTTPKELSRHVELVHHIIDPESLPKEEIHKCSYAGCGRSFSKKGNLNVHVRTVHEKRRDFVCGQTEVSLPEIGSDVVLEGCGRDFTSKSTLEEHVRTAHLGMQAKRVERNKKRRAEKQQAGEEDGAVSKKRRTRKDKGVKKTSAIQSLINGFPVYQRGNLAQADDYKSDEGEESDTYSVYDDDDDDDEDAGLTGSMVMHGSHIFHGDSTFHFESGSSSMSTEEQADPVYQPVSQGPILEHDQLPSLKFDDMNFDHNFGFAGNYSLNLSSTTKPQGLPRQSSMPTQPAAQFEVSEGEWYELELQGPEHTEPRPRSIPVDPLLLA